VRTKGTANNASWDTLERRALEQGRLNIPLRTLRQKGVTLQLVFEAGKRGRLRVELSAEPGWRSRILLSRSQALLLHRTLRALVGDEAGPHAELF